MPQVVADPGFNEIDLGLWNNRLLSELPAEAARMKRFRFEADATLEPHNGECFLAFLERTQAALQRLNQRFPSGTTVLISHSTTISAIRMHAKDPVFVDENSILRWTGKGIRTARYLRFNPDAGLYQGP